MSFGGFMMIATNIVAIALIAVVLIQGQTSAGLGSALVARTSIVRAEAWKRRSII